MIIEACCTLPYIEFFAPVFAIDVVTIRPEIPVLYVTIGRAGEKADGLRMGKHDGDHEEHDLDR